MQSGFIEHSNSPQASLCVRVLKQPEADGHSGVRLAIDFRWANKFTEPTAANLDYIGELIQKVGSSCFISIIDTNSNYHHTFVKESDRWLTSFVCSLSQFQWISTPFVVRNSDNAFTRTLQKILQPIMHLHQVICSR